MNILFLYFANYNYNKFKLTTVLYVSVGKGYIIIILHRNILYTRRSPLNLRDDLETVRIFLFSPIIILAHVYGFGNPYKIEDS